MRCPPVAARQAVSRAERRSVNTTHGRIVWQFRDYVESRHRKISWESVLKAAGLDERVYLAQAYPDEEALALFKATARMSGKSAPVLLQDFGEFTVPALLGMYSHFIKSEWRTLDVIENAERVAHGAARQHEPGVAPPHLLVRRVNSHKLILTYSSPRRMCEFAVGVGIGLGKHFQERVIVQHNPCVHFGADHCEIAFSVE